MRCCKGPSQGCLIIDIDIIQCSLQMQSLAECVTRGIDAATVSAATL